MINKNALGVAIGLSFAIYMFLMALLALIFDWGTEIVDITRDFYIGYDASLVGAIIGAIWGFVDGYIFGFLIALFYNVALKKPQAPLQAQTQGHGYDIMKK